MLTKEDIERYKLIQARGIPISQDLISISDAVKVVNRTKMLITKIKAENPARAEDGRITWFIIGSMIMLDRASLIEVALARGWIEEVG